MTLHNVHDEESSGRPSVVTDKLKARFEAKWMRTGKLIRTLICIIELTNFNQISAAMPTFLQDRFNLNLSFDSVSNNWERPSGSLSWTFVRLLQNQILHYLVWKISSTTGPTQEAQTGLLAFRMRHDFLAKGKIS